MKEKTENVPVSLRISPYHFDDTMDYIRFKDFDQRRSSKSEFYRSALLPKIKATLLGKEDSFNKLMQFVDLMGLDKVLEKLEDNTPKTPVTNNAMSPEQMQQFFAMMQMTQQSNNTGNVITPVSETETVQKDGSIKQSKEQLMKLMGLSAKKTE